MCAIKRRIPLPPRGCLIREPALPRRLMSDPRAASRSDRLGTRLGGPLGRPLCRPLALAAVLSCIVHAGLALLLLLAGRRPPIQPHETGAIELVMVEKKGVTDAAPAQPVSPPPADREQAAPPAPDSKVTAATAPAEQQDVPPPAQPAPPAPPQPRPTPPAAAKPPVFDLAGTESDTNAIVFGDKILPALPDSRYRNRAPIYPREAELQRQHGTVIVLIHVSATGLTAGAEIAETSGVKALDDAALAAVRTWHFRPAMRDGRAMPFDMPFRFVFQAD